MSWVILTGRKSDLDDFATPHKIISNRDYLSHPALFRGPAAEDHQPVQQLRLSEPRLLRLAAGRCARPPRHPSVETMIDLTEKKLYENALPELEQALNKARGRLGGAFPARVAIFFGPARRLPGIASRGCSSTGSAPPPWK
jgi:hypothetical protein